MRKSVDMPVAERTQLRHGVTLLELMLSITILLAAFSLMLPVMSAIRKANQVNECLDHLHLIANTAFFYNKDNDPTGRGTYATQPWYLDWPGAAYVSEYVYGGFQTPIDAPAYPNSDVYLIPTELRPYNKYIAPGIAGRQPIKAYVCPADTFIATPLVGGPEPVVDERFGSWEVNGNSYAINWHWVNGIPDVGGQIYDLPCFSLFGSAMLQKKVGSAASEFVLFMEACMNAYMSGALPPDGSHGNSPLQELGIGWHGKLSTYSMGFYDGHAEYRYIDTRYSSDVGYDTWPERDTAWPQGCSK